MALKEKSERIKNWLQSSGWCISRSINTSYYAGTVRTPLEKLMYVNTVNFPMCHTHTQVHGVKFHLRVWRFFSSKQHRIHITTTKEFINLFNLSNTEEKKNKLESQANLTKEEHSMQMMTERKTCL